MNLVPHCVSIECILIYPPKPFMDSLVFHSPPPPPPVLIPPVYPPPPHLGLYIPLMHNKICLIV